MTCDDMEARSLEALRGELDPVAAADFRAHLVACPACAAGHAEAQAAWDLLMALPTVEPGPGVSFSRLLRRHHRRGRLLGLAAAVLVLVGTGLAFGLFLGLRGDARGMSEGGQLIALLHQDLGSARLTGIALSQGATRPDPVLSAALLDLVDRDPETRVRLAAVEALYLFSGDPAVQLRILQAVPRQESAQVQMALVDLLAAQREREAAAALRSLLQGNRLPPSVRQRLKADLARLDPL